MVKTLVIVGPTASGKTGLAVEVAREIGGEVISADSRAIYKGMDIGTAKPTVEEMGGVKHWGIDLVEPGERFTVADFKKYTLGCIADIKRRGKVPIIVGGTGLYVDAVIYGYQFSDVAKKTCSDRTEMDAGYVVVGIRWDKDVLRQRIRQRADNIFEQDIIGETERLAKRYGWGSQAMKSNIYPIVQEMTEGKITESEAKELFELEDWHLAKRQMTWFARNKDIKWMGIDELREYIYNIYK